MEQQLRRATSTAARAATALGALGGSALAVALDPPVPLWAAALAGSTAPAVAGGLVWFGAARPLLAAVAAADARRHRAEERATELEELAALDERLEVAVRAAETETELLEVVGRGLATVLADRDDAVLLAPPDGHRVTWMVPAGPEGLGEPRPLGAAQPCTARVTGRTAWTPAAGGVGGCAHGLDGADDDGVRSALCVPFPPVGVLHSAGAPGDEIDPARLRVVERLARRAGERARAMRSIRREEDHVATDPLTGLANHTVAHRTMRDLLAEERSFAVALCDLDGFARYNAAVGNEGGDLALRLFAEVLGAALRPSDLLARYQGDRFLCVFPDCSAEHAASAMERVRERLVLELASHELDPFTASVGVGDAVAGSSVDQVVEDADVALGVAKHEGGNRVRSARFDSPASA